MFDKVFDHLLVYCKKEKLFLRVSGVVIFFFGFVVFTYPGLFFPFALIALDLIVYELGCILKLMDQFKQ